MPYRKCCHSTGHRPCTCEMGNIYRFVEPIVLLTLLRSGSAHGYQIAQDAEHLSITHAGVDVAAVYRVLRKLEDAGYVKSEWNTEGSGPARRQYSLTGTGIEHLKQWTSVLDDVRNSLSLLLDECRRVLSDAAADDNGN